MLDVEIEYGAVTCGCCWGVVRVVGLCNVVCSVDATPFWTIPYDTTQYHTTAYHTTPHHTTLYLTTSFCTIPYDTMQYHTHHFTLHSKQSLSVTFVVFPGAEDAYTNFVSIEERIQNHESWLGMKSTFDSTNVKVSGIALTGWSR